MELKKWIRFILPIAIAAAVIFAFQPVMVMADEETDDGGTTEGTTEEEGPSLTSPAQVQRAINISEAASEISQADVDEAQAKLDSYGTDSETAYNEWQDALAELEDDPEAYTDEEIAAMEKLYNDVLAAEQALDDATAKMAGVSVESIEAMRADGMGWGEICHELGLHPSINGLGHQKQFKKSEMTEATARNMKNGLSKGHVDKTSGDSSGVGLGRAQAKKSAGKGASGKGGSGKGGGKSGSKGKGSGKSNGKGKGKGKSK